MCNASGDIFPDHQKVGQRDKRRRKEEEEEAKEEEGAFECTKHIFLNNWSLFKLLSRNWSNSSGN